MKTQLTPRRTKVAKGILFLWHIFLFSVFVFLVGCRVKPEYLPQMTAPYLSQMEFYKDVKNVAGKAEIERFEDDKVTSPFYFYLMIRDLENDGRVRVVFYQVETVDKEKKSRLITEKFFRYGKSGKYYEYILFFDRVEKARPGQIRYAVFVSGNLLCDGQLKIHKKHARKTKKK